MTPEEQALKSSIEQRLKRLSPTVTNNGQGLTVTVRGQVFKLPFSRSTPVSTRNIT